LHLHGKSRKQVHYHPNSPLIAMRQALLIIGFLLLAAFILFTGNGLQGTLLAVRANIDGFALPLIGFLLSAYFVGFIAGCRFAPRLIAYVGHIRTFTALASVASASSLAHAIFIDPPFWIALRVISGFCFAGLYMIIESWINEKASNDNRGRILSVYRIVDLSAMTMGQILLVVADPADFVLFAMVSILISISLVPVAVTRSVAPAPVKRVRLDLVKMYRLSPLAVAGAFGVGAANGAFWAIGPVFVQRIGYDVEAVAVFMSAAIIGGALSQWPLGWISDKMDRRWVIVSVSALGAASGIYLSLFAATSFLALLIGAALFGFFAMPIFGLSAAHANDQADPGEFVAVSGGLFLLFGAGSIVGPIAAPVLMELSGPQVLFQYTAGVHALLACFGLYRMMRRAAPGPEDKADYVAIPRTSPNVFELDPRNETADEKEDGAAKQEQESDAVL
jgi:MFS family permease